MFLSYFHRGIGRGVDVVGLGSPSKVAGLTTAQLGNHRF